MKNASRWSIISLIVLFPTSLFAGKHDAVTIGKYTFKTQKTLKGTSWKILESQPKPTIDKKAKAPSGKEKPPVAQEVDTIRLNTKGEYEAFENLIKQRLDLKKTQPIPADLEKFWGRESMM